MIHAPRELSRSLFLFTVGLGFTARTDRIPKVAPVDTSRRESEIAKAHEAGNETGPICPPRIFGENEFFPKARVYFGSIRDAVGAGGSLLGMEFKGTTRWGGAPGNRSPHALIASGA